MIRICENCGGLYATEHLEMFAGTPCKCGAKRRLIVAPPDVACSEWVDALAKVESAIIAAYQLSNRPYNKELSESMFGTLRLCQDELARRSASTQQIWRKE